MYVVICRICFTFDGEGYKFILIDIFYLNNQFNANIRSIKYENNNIRSNLFLNNYIVEPIFDNNNKLLRWESIF